MTEPSDSAAAPDVSDTALRRYPARLVRCLEVRSGCSEWEVESGDHVARAIAYPLLTGPLRPGDRVLLNATAVSLGLGTGGVHFVIASSEPPPPAAPAPEFPDRAAGHILKLRYTPLQLRVRAAEEEASPHRQAILEFAGLHGTPVLGAELHSQAGAAILAVHAAAPSLRVVLVQLDTAALPLAFSRLVARLREAGLLHSTVTVGQGFGGELEAINVYSGLIAARAAARADVVVVSQGPGNAGTDSEYGFSGLALTEAFHAAAHLGGVPILAPRLSMADPRPRHQGLSHHTATLLRCARTPVLVPFPPGFRPAPEVPEPRHPRVLLDPAPVLPALRPHADLLRSMGRGPDQDPLFFAAAAAAGMLAARHALALQGNETP